MSDIRVVPVVLSSHGRVSRKLAQFCVLVYLSTVAVDAFIRYHTPISYPLYIIAFGGIVLLWFWDVIITKRIWFSRIFICLGVMVMALMMSSVSTRWSISDSVWRTVVVIFHMLSCIFVVGVARRYRINVSRVVMGGAVVLILAGVVALVTGTYGHANRLTLVPGYNPTWLAASAILYLLAIGSLKWRNRPIMIPIVLGLSCLTLTILAQGRNALFGFLVASFLSWIVLNIKTTFAAVWKNKLLAITCITIVFICVVYFYQNPEILNNNLPRIAATFSGDAYYATSGRNEIAEAYYDAVISRSLLFGEGTGSSLSYMTHVSANTRANPHNNYLRLVLEGGVVAMVAWVIFHLLLIIRVVRSRETSKGLVPFALFFLIFGFGNDIVYYQYYWVGLTLLLIVLNFNFDYYDRGYV